MFTLTFWKDALERAAKTFAQGVLGLLTIGNGFGAVNWGHTLSVAGVMALASILTSVVSSGVGASDSASLIADGSGQHRA